MQMEHTTCKDPLTDEAAVVSEFDFILHLFPPVSELYGYLSMQISTPHAIAIDMYIYNHMIYDRGKNV